jgi:hypothetical protein
MATIDYPITLPRPQIAGSTMKGGSTFIRSNFDYAVRTRKQYNPQYQVSYDFIIATSAQMELFRDFYYLTLNHGIDAFNATFEVEGDTTSKEFRFADIYNAAPMGGGLYRVSATFDMLTEMASL